MKHIFLGLLLILFIGGCAESPTLRKKTAECYARYLASDGKWLAEVTLREQSDKQSGMQEVESPAGVKYQGIPMKRLPVQGITYQLEQPGRFIATQQFDWQDQQKKEYSFKSTMPAITGFSFGTDRLSNKQPASLRWEGPPLEKKETLILMWETTDGQFTVPMEIIGTAGQAQIDFPAAQLSKLPAGNWSLYLVRKKQVTQNINGTNALAVLEYYSQPDTLQILD